MEPDRATVPAAETQALVVREPGARARVETLTVGPPGAGEVRVRMAASGICHTDLLVTEGRSWWPDYPYVLGHEGAGIIESVGPGVDRGRVGQAVLLAWKAPCGRCRFCVRGAPRSCVDPPRVSGRLRLADGTPATASLRVGSHAGLAVVPNDAAVELPAEVDLRQACLMGCAVLTGVGAATHTARVRSGEGVVVFGCGGVGLSVIAGCRLSGAAPIIAVDPIAARLEVAERMGASHALHGTSDGVVDAVRGLAAGNGVDHAFDAVGAGRVIVDALRCLDTGGTCTLVGTPEVTDMARIPLELLYLRRLRLLVSQYGDALPAEDVPRLVGAWRSGELALAPLVTEEIGLREAPAGLEALREGRAIRTVVQFEPSGDAATIDR